MTDGTMAAPASSSPCLVVCEGVWNRGWEHHPGVTNLHQLPLFLLED
jgi:hypothetical protein